MSFNNSTQCRIIKAAANSVFIISIVWSMIGSIHAVGFSRRRKKISAVGTCRKKEILFNGSSRYSSWVSVFLHIIIVVSGSKQRIRVYTDWTVTEDR